MFRRFALAIVLCASLALGADGASLLGNAKQQFVDSNGVPLAIGSVETFIPGTNTHKNTWSDPALSSLNSNPLTLDSAGRAIIWGVGAYRQLVKDASGNTIWDQVTNNWPDLISILIPATAGGTGNAIALTPVSGVQTTGMSALSPYQQILFLATQNNSAATTASFAATSGTLGPYPIYTDVSTGVTVLNGSEIRSGNLYTLNYDSTLAGSTGGWHLGGPGSLTAVFKYISDFITRLALIDSEINQIFLNLAANLASSGASPGDVPPNWLRIPSGGESGGTGATGAILIQYGQISALADGATVTVTLPKPFSTTAYVIAANTVNVDGPVAKPPTITPVTTTTFTIKNNSGGGTNIVGMHYIIIGGSGF